MSTGHLTGAKPSLNASLAVDYGLSKFRQNRKSIKDGLDSLTKDLNGSISMYVKNSKQARSARKEIKKRNIEEKSNMSEYKVKSRIMDVHNRKGEELDDGEKN